MFKKSIFTLMLMAVIGCISAQSLRFEWDGTVYEDGAVSLSFDAEGLTVDSAYASESIAYADDSGVGDFTCRTDVATLLTQVKAQDGDEIIIQYGKENAIKIIDGKVTSVVALLE